MELVKFIFALQIGVVLTHLALTTPVVFNSLDEHESSGFLRKIFPRYYLFLTLLSLVPLIYALFYSLDGLLWYLIFANFVHSFIGLIIIPVTNFSRDRAWERLFSLFHGLSIYCTIVITAIALIVFFIDLQPKSIEVAESIFTEIVTNADENISN
tara:strand:+ start:71 stop:535 length:465 start_codon:yes stop_codon:yes gene_type:complete